MGNKNGERAHYIGCWNHVSFRKKKDQLLLLIGCGVDRCDHGESPSRAQLFISGLMAAAVSLKV